MTARGKWHGARARRAVRAAGARGVRAGTELVFEATQRVVPRDTDELADSGRVEIDEPALRGEIHYGEGLPDERAVIIHEKPEIRHDDGQAKYVEEPLRANAGAAVREIAAELRRALD